MIRKNISLNIEACLSGLSFSFDELIIETRKLFEDEGVPGFLKLLISWTDEVVVNQVKTTNKTSCCDGPKLLRNGKRNKIVYTSLGNIDLNWTSLRCKTCNTTHNPLKDFLGLTKYQKVSNEFEKICMETIAKESFRRSADTLRLHRNVDFNHRSLHRWFLNTSSDQIKMKHSNLKVIMGDGTGFKKFISLKKQKRRNKLLLAMGKPVIEKSKRGEVRILIGIDHDNKIIPMGAWTEPSWKTIGNFVFRANNPNRKVISKKVANILVADGEIGLNLGLKKLTHHQQRCLWHIPRELRSLLKYQSRAPKEDINYTMEKMNSLFNIDIPDSIFSEVSKTELIEVNEKIRACDLEMKNLTDYLFDKGYSQASTYVRNARNNLFSYLKLWMKTGIITPKVTSRLERLMREINRRIKKFAFNWSEKGCAKITRLVIKLITDKKSWDHYWDIKMKLSGNIKLSFSGMS